MPRERVGLGTRLAYGFGSISEGVKNTAFDTFLLFYHNVVLGPVSQRFDKRRTAVLLSTSGIFFGPLPIFLRLLGWMPPNGHPALMPLLILHSVTLVTGLIILGIALDGIAFPTHAAPGTVADDEIFLLGLAVGPCMFLLHLLSLVFLRRYRMTRARHAEILQEIERRRSAAIGGLALRP